jgi:hypothetical protein
MRDGVTHRTADASLLDMSRCRKPLVSLGESGHPKSDDVGPFLAVFGQTWWPVPGWFLLAKRRGALSAIVVIYC